MHTRRKLSIAMFMYPDLAKAGGVQEATYCTVRGLEKRGHNVTVFGTKGTLYLPFRRYIGSCHAFPVVLPHGNASNITIPMATKPATSELINAGNFDICHLQDAYVPFVAYDILKNVRMPKVSTFNSAWNESSNIAFISSMLPIFQQEFCRFIDGAIFISKLAQTRWQGLVDNSVRKRVIYYGIDEIYVPSNRISPGSPIRLLFVARVVARKGLLYLLKALKELVKKRYLVVLDVVGDGPDRAGAEKYVAENALTKVVRFHGEVVGKKKVAFFQNADIFCAPYADEAFALAVYEAIGCGLAIVGFKNDVFTETLAGYPAPELIVKQKDSTALASAIERCIKSPQLLEMLRSWGITERTKHTWERTAQETEAFYYEILKRHQTSGRFNA